MTSMSLPHLVCTYEHIHTYIHDNDGDNNKINDDSSMHAYTHTYALDLLADAEMLLMVASLFLFFIVSFTASQASPAVGRALAIPLAAHLQKESFFPKVSE